MREILQVIPGLAASGETVLIVGERGSGKELVARAIHAARSPPSGPLVAVDCGAIPEKLAESFLFGHVRGAFTDAFAAHPGAFAQADCGVLFLDEIGNLPLVVQPKLLRVLESRQYQPGGASVQIGVDVQVVAATNVDLAARPELRPDLYDRVAVHTIEIPPLRERPEDIGPLLDHFLAAACAHAGVPLPSLAPEVRAWAKREPWPSNARGLRTLVARCLLRLDGRDAITMELVRETQRPTGRIRTDAVPAPPPAAPGYVPPPDWRPRMKDSPRKLEIMQEALAACGTKAAAARALGMSWWGFAAALRRLRARLC